MKKISTIVISFLLLLFSFYYTKIAIDVIRINDPIMRKININKYKYKEKYINATINNDEVICGKSGIKIDVNKSYLKMHKYGSYNENLYVKKYVSPKVSINNYYDKYIVKTRKINKVSLIYIINSDKDKEIIKYLDNNITIFLDGKYLEKNKRYILSLINKGYEIELLSYDKEYDPIYFKNSLSILKDLKKDNNLYCYSEYKNKELLDLCSKLKLHTVIPNLILDNNSYTNIKNKLEDGIIIKLAGNKNDLLIINYIKQRGKKIVPLKELLDE